MKAFVQDRYGSPDVLELREIDRPQPQEGRVLVKIRAASVNAMDWHLVEGSPFLARMMYGLAKPKFPTRGVDLAGEVEDTGPNVTRWKRGDEVFGTARGSFAEYATARESDLAAKPGNVTFDEAAAVPVAGFTALQALRDGGHLNAGQRVLIYGAGGGVGTFAVQLARSMGAHVTAVTGTENVDLVRSLGAEEVIDYRREDFAQRGRGYDVFLDIGADRPLSDCRRVLGPNGAYVGVGAASNDGMFSILAGLIGMKVASPFVSQRLVSILAHWNAGDLAYLKERLEDKSLVPAIDRRYLLDQVPEAIRYVRSQRARGKVVIQVS